MRLERRLDLALNGIASGFRFIDSRRVQCGSEHAYRLPMGKCSSDVEKRIDSLVAAVGAPVELIDRGGAVIVRVVEKDYPKQLGFNSVHFKEDRLLIGYDRLLNPVYVKLMHFLMGGASGAGKTMAIRFLLLQLIKMGAVIKIIDMKGYSFFPFQTFSNVSVATDITSAADLMNEAATEIESRMQRIMHAKDRSLTKSLPPYIVLIDEAGQIAPHTYPKGKSRALAAYCDDTCARIAQVGRESRLFLFYCTQKPSRDIVNGQVKANVESMISFRTNNHYESEIILGEPGAERISPSTPGRCIYKYDRKYNIQVPFIGEEDEDWTKLLSSLHPEVIQLGSSKRTKTPRINAEGSFRSTDSDNETTSHVEPKSRSAKESVKDTKGTGKGKAGHAPSTRLRKDMVAQRYTDEIAD